MSCWTFLFAQYITGTLKGKGGSDFASQNFFSCVVHPLHPRNYLVLAVATKQYGADLILVYRNLVVF